MGAITFDTSAAFAAEMDARDPLATFREQFHIPPGPDGCSSIYVLAQIAIDVTKKPSEVAHQRRQSDKLDYELRVEKSKPGIVKVVPLG